MPIEILMPALSPTMEEGKLAKWHVKPGDAVRSGDVIAEIETDKATMEVEAVDEGTIGKILIAEGTEHVPVNTPIAVLIGEDESHPGEGAQVPVSKGEAGKPPPPEDLRDLGERPPDVEQAPAGPQVAPGGPPRRAGHPP